MISEFAPAKVNLSLHITGQRADGYHLLDSLVVFADIGDRLDIFEANTLSLTIEGPMAAGVPTDISNSILKAAQLFEPQETGAGFLLTKNLPAAAGIGGGSADAAAAFRGLLRLWGDKTPEQLFAKGLDPNQLTSEEQKALSEHIKSLGADVPVCLFSRTTRMQGIGEQLSFIKTLPPLHAVLINPGVSISTPLVFQAITQKNNSGLPETPQSFANVADYIDWLASLRNDMQTAACKIAPVIDNVIDHLKNSAGCKLARMSGSGATCFGLYLNAETADRAASTISAAQPDWWVKPCLLGSAR